jgi:hypothetical protein
MPGGSLAECRATVRDVIRRKLPEGSAATITTAEIIAEATARHAFDGLEAELQHFGKIKVVHDEAERMVSAQGRRVLVSIEQLDLLGRVWKRADTLLPGEEARGPRRAFSAHILGLLRKIAPTVLSPERSKRAVAFLEALFAEQDREDAGRVA